MSGEISVMKRNWKAELFALVIAGAAAFVFNSALFRFWEVSGVARGAVGALTAYLLCRTAFGALAVGGDVRRIAWERTADALILDGASIPLDAIRAVHCWPTRDAFGRTLPGWTVNIETGRRNTLLRSPTTGPDAERAAVELEMLVRALGGRVPS